MKNDKSRFSPGCVRMANCQTVQAGNILCGWYRQIVYGLWTVMIIGVAIATSSYVEGRIA